MADHKSDAALDHEDGDPMPMLHGTVEFAEYVTADGEVFHLCRDSGGGLVLMVDDGVVAHLDEDVTRWLASRLVGALDDWPMKG